MGVFRIDPVAVRRRRAAAAACAAGGAGAALCDALARGEELDAESLATLFLSPAEATDRLLDLARRRRAPGSPRIETFSPLYLSNECDAECRMCGMRRFNPALRRETATDREVEEQLELLHRRGLRAVALLTGEYHRGPRRLAMQQRVHAALRGALTRDFRHVLVNAGAFDAEEYAPLLEGVGRRSSGQLAPQVTMCTFQETYDPEIYARFMGTAPDNPRSDFERRLGNLDRAADAGMWSANPGVLLGLNPDLAFELIALVEHARHLLARGLAVYLSLPRLRKASGAPHRVGVSDDALIRLVALLSAGVPEARVVISTREPPEIQRRLVPVIGVLTPGSPGVAPYTETGARFESEASQFEVLDHRPIEAILGEFLAAGTRVDGYEPAAPV